MRWSEARVLGGKITSQASINSEIAASELNPWQATADGQKGSLRAGAARCVVADEVLDLLAWSLRSDDLVEVLAPVSCLRTDQRQRARRVGLSVHRWRLRARRVHGQRQAIELSGRASSFYPHRAAAADDPGGASLIYLFSLRVLHRRGPHARAPR